MKNRSDCSGLRGADMAENADSGENSLLIPCITGNSAGETSSLETGPTTTAGMYTQFVSFIEGAWISHRNPVCFASNITSQW
jgi:hypothetical protein